MATKSTNANSKPRKGEHVDPEQKIETALDKTELFFQKYTKQLLTGLLVVVIVVGGYFAYEYLVKRPRAVKAAEMMFVAEQLFAAEDYTAALEGDGSNAGFLDVEKTCIAAVALECGRIVLCCEKLFGNEHHLGGLDGTGPLHEVFVSEIAAHDNHHYEQPRKQLLGIFLEKQFGLIESGLDFLFRVYMFPFPGFRISVRGFSGHK